MGSRLNLILAGALAAAVLFAAGAEASGRKYTVNRSSDPGPGRCKYKTRDAKRNKCSLRGAIRAANGHSGPDRIVFKIGKGRQTIAVNGAKGPLPRISGKVSLDGSTQPGYSSTPLIRIDGEALASGSGVEIAAGGTATTVRGLAVARFPDEGILIAQASNVRVLGCWIGLSAGGRSGAGNGDRGILLEAASGVKIGAAGKDSRNVISDNAGGGIAATQLAGPTTILNNRIGTSADGSKGVGNGGNGIDLSDGHGPNVIGAPGAGNVISDNANDGIQGFDDIATAPGATIQGNLIGISAGGSVALGNGGDGIDYASPGALTLGGTTASQRNVISGNDSNAVNLHGQFPGSPTNSVQGNYIGTNQSGTAAIGNAAGIRDDQVGGLRIGGEAANVISGQVNGTGISVTDAGGVKILGNRIGVAASSATPQRDLGNGFGIYLGPGSGQTTIGGTGTGEPNTIGNSTYDGILAEDSAALDIVANFIGTDRDGSVKIGNGSDDPGDAGIHLVGGDGRIGQQAGGQNVIVNNFGPGVLIDSSAYFELSRNLIFGNSRLGIDLTSPIQSGSGVTANDSLDGDLGPNALVNYPVIDSVTGGGGGTNYAVSLDAKPNTTYRIELFAGTECDPSGFGEGGFFLVSGSVSTNGAGVGSAIIFKAQAPPPPGISITGTAATDELIIGGNLATSEFGPCLTM
ncbi:hypothetical protein BH10ACT11_BH10ACT11_01630 [soil metagenome]